MKPVLAWHFVAKDRRLNHGDGRVVRKGQTLRVEPPIVLCKRGLHASVDVLDALSHAESEQVVACRVRVGGVIVHADDKLAGKRTGRADVWLHLPAAPPEASLPPQLWALAHAAKAVGL